MRERLPARAIHQFVPIDTPAATARFLDHWQPQAGLFVDSDMWPNLILGAKARNVELALVNARMSERSFDGWRWAPKTAATLLSAFDICLAQDDEIADRFRKLGAHDVRGTIGSLKADAPPLPADPGDLSALQQAIMGRPVLLAAQTHPGEDETILPVHDTLRQTIPSLLTIIVPRHVERGPEIAMLCGARAARRRALGELPLGDTAVYIADTMGELGIFYRLALFAFVGGSLVRHGGQNPLEPARGWIVPFWLDRTPSISRAPTMPSSMRKVPVSYAPARTSPISREDCSAIQPPRSPSVPRQQWQQLRSAAPSPKPSSRSSTSWPTMRAPDFWTRDDWRSRLLAPLGWLYGASVAWKARGAAPYRSDATVVCVGNLSVGGTGKTPVAIEIARLFVERGRKPFFLSRGYGGKFRGPLEVTAAHRAADVGDEPLLLAHTAPVIVSRDRRAGAMLAVEHGADTIIMDDGHQNFALAKDLSLVVVDGEAGFGNGRVVPAGPLREPVARGLARADAVIVTGDGAPALDNFFRPVLRTHLTHLEPDITGEQAYCRVCRHWQAGQILSISPRTGRQSSGHEKLRRPSRLYRRRNRAGCDSKARAHNAELVTTEKDFCPSHAIGARGNPRPSRSGDVRRRHRAGALA